MFRKEEFKTVNINGSYNLEKMGKVREGFINDGVGTNGIRNGWKGWFRQGSITKRRKRGYSIIPKESPEVPRTLGVAEFMRFLREMVLLETALWGSS
jgi:hypothetical protein